MSIESFPFSQKSTFMTINLQQFLAKALRDVLWHQKRMQVIARANLINNSEGVPEEPIQVTSKTGSQNM